MLEIQRLGAVLELGPLLNEQFHEFRMLVEILQVSANGGHDSIDRVGHRGDRLVDSLREPMHTTIDSGEKKFALGGEITVNGALANAKFLGDGIHVGVGIAVFGE